MAITVQLAERSPEPPVIELTADDFAEFVSGYGAWVSTGGAFVAGDVDVEKSSEVDLLCRMADGFTLVRARCLVAWTRQRPDELGRPAGVGLHFLRIDDGQQLLEKMVENQLAASLPVFDVDRSRPAEGGSAPSAERLHRMSSQRGDRPELQALRSDRVDPVQDLHAAKAFAPGMETMPREAAKPSSTRSTAEFRAPVPSGVFRTLDHRQADPSPGPSSPRVPSSVTEAPGSTTGEAASAKRTPAVREAPEGSSEQTPGPVAAPSSPAERSSGYIEVSEVVRSEASSQLEELFASPATQATQATQGTIPERAASRAPAPAQAPPSVPEESPASVGAPAALTGQLHVDSSILSTNEWRAPGTSEVPADEPSSSFRSSRSRLWVVLGGAALLVPSVWLWTELPAEHRWSLETLAGRAEGEGDPSAVEADASRASVCEDVSFEVGPQETRITLQFDGHLPPTALSDVRLDGSLPRHVFKMVGLGSAPLPLIREVGSPQVRRIRFGLHRLGGEFRLHAVVDLEADASVVGQELGEDTLVLLVRS